MVRHGNGGSHKRGFLTIEAMVGIAILVIVLLPLRSAMVSDGKALITSYQRAVAMEIVDGEMEALAAGDWRTCPEGSGDYAVHSKAAANLPKGRFLLTRHGNQLRLEWQPTGHSGVGKVVREAAGR